MKDTFSPYKIFSLFFGQYWTLIIGPPFDILLRLL